MLGVCSRLENKTGIDKFWFRLLFVIWFFSSGWALVWYFIISFIID